MIPIQSPDIRAVYLKDKAGARAYQLNDTRLPERLREIRRKLVEHWKQRELHRSAAR